MRGKIEDWHAQGVLNAWSDYANKTYRVLSCVKLAIRRGVSLEDLSVDKCGEIRRRGKREKHDYWPFYVDVDRGVVVIEAGSDTWEWPIDTAKSVWYHIVERGGFVDKYIYYEWKPWLRFAIRPFAVVDEEGRVYIPPLIRMFYNPLNRTKEELGVRLPDGWTYEHDNWVLPEDVTEQFLRRNHQLAFSSEIREWAREHFRRWFLEDVELVVKLTQIELTRDVEIPKHRLLVALHTVQGHIRVLKNSAMDKEAQFVWTDSGVKYYITIRRRPAKQLKVYTKAFSDKRVLNRVEYTVNVESDVGLVSVKDVIREVSDVHMQLARGLVDGPVLREVESYIEPLLRCRAKCENHKAFLFDLLTLGCVKGSRYYHDVVKLYASEGIVRSKGRGRASVWCLNEAYLPFSNDVRERILKLLGIVLYPAKEEEPEGEVSEEEGVKIERFKARDIFDRL